MARIRNKNWLEDDDLKADLTRYVREGLSRSEILDFVRRDYSFYAWSIRTLDRRLRQYQIFYNDKNVTVDDVRRAVEIELAGPGKQLGYRAMHNKIRQLYELNVPRGLVYDVMYHLDPRGLEERAPGGKKRRKGHFVSEGSNWVHSLDGHSKLMGFQNNTFPITVYGCIDTASRKLLWAKVWSKNCDPDLVGRWYLEYLFEHRVMATRLRVDRGSETGTMATMHAFLRQHHGDMDPTDTVIYGPSTANQIERWWRELHERLEKFYKKALSWLKEHGHYAPDSQLDRHAVNLLAYLMVPIIQKEVDTFKDVIWNTHRIRKQRNTFLPDGIPNHIYAFPEQYGLRQCGWEVTEAQLEEVANESKVLTAPSDFIDANTRAAFENIIPDPLQVKPDECIDAYLYLKNHYPSQ